jgi:diaminohydroxyphosphoribosylaminopyrimidine deaminase/5-amino-6-(5-phosphoribosylamino)uracil reductase
MRRCIELARLGAGTVAPNPMVGAVLVHQNRIIGEGYHMHYGQAHAEVNCLNSVKDADKHFISQSILYVSLEPCAHFGKTPPCADLIILHQIKKVIVGCRDPFKQVDGRGIEKLRETGVEVITAILEKECIELNKFFFTYHLKHRPYIIIKWAQSADTKIAGPDFSRVHISNDITNRVVHRWRSEAMSILVGTNTALYDNPSLTTRLWKGNNPVRLVVDMDLRLPRSLKIFGTDSRTIVFNAAKHEEFENLLYYQVVESDSLAHQICNALYHLNIHSVIVEGGPRLIQSFLDEGMWDEARVITNNLLTIPNGLPAPLLPSVFKTTEQEIMNDTVSFFKPHTKQFT